MQEVVALNQLVGELGERHAVALAVEALLDRVLGHHVVDGDALADVTDEIEERELLHPVVVVDHLCGIRGVRLEIEQFGQLAFDRILIVAEGLLVEQVALLRLARGVADHARGTADERQRTVAAHLEMLEDHHTYQMADMQRVGRGVDAQISRRHLFFELFLCAGHDRVDRAAPFEFFDEILCCHYCVTLFYFQFWGPEPVFIPLTFRRP